MDTKPSGNATEGRTAARRDRLAFDHVDYPGTSVILGIAAAWLLFQLLRSRQDVEGLG